MRSPSPRRPMWLAGGLAVLLAALAVLQWQWIGRWGAVEEVRLRSLLHASAADFDRDLTARLYHLGRAFSDASVRGPEASDTLAARLGAWRATAETPDLVEAVYRVRPGPDPALSVLDGDTLRPTAWPEALTPWLQTAERFPARLVPEPGTDVARLTINDATLPATPPGLLVPVLPPPTGDLRFVLVTLDPAVLADVVGGLLAEHFGSADLFAFRLVSAADPDERLYDGAPEADAFVSPDLDVGIGFGEVQELAFALPTAAGPASSGDINVSQEVESTAGAEGAGPHRWRLVAQHEAGSIATAVRTLRRRQAGLAFGVLSILAAAVALLVDSARRQRALAARQLAFVAGVSHELRTPLAVLRTAGENLADGVVGDDGTRRYGALVRDESQRLAEMVETVLTYAGADAATPRRTRVPVAEVVADALALARPTLDEAGATVDLALGPEAALDADPAAVATALRNLLGNAARHGGRAIRLGACETTHAGAPAIALSVSDDGPGVPEADRADLFEPFVRGQAAVAAQTPGSGLGLALVRRVAETHGGTVALRDGSTFVLTLPAAP